MNRVLEISETQLNEDMNSENVIGREGRNTDSQKCSPHNNGNGNMSINLKENIILDIQKTQ